MVVAAALSTSGGAALASSPISGSAHHSSSPALVKSSTKTTKTPKLILSQSLSGSKKTKTFTAKKGWQLSYDYNCGGKKGKFVLYLNKAHGKRLEVTSQSGLGGGGARTYKAGRYSLSAKTKCKWTVHAKKKS
jgi:hypothetical protein